MSANLKIALASVVAIVLTLAGLANLPHQPLAQPQAVACNPGNPGCRGDRQNLPVELACNGDNPGCGGDRQNLPVELA